MVSTITSLFSDNVLVKAEEIRPSHEFGEKADTEERRTTPIEIDRRRMACCFFYVDTTRAEKTTSKIHYDSQSNLQICRFSLWSFGGMESDG